MRGSLYALQVDYLITCLQDTENRSLVAAAGSYDGRITLLEFPDYLPDPPVPVASEGLAGATRPRPQPQPCVVGTLPGAHGGVVRGLCFTGGLLMSGGEDGKLVVWQGEAEGGREQLVDKLASNGKA